MRRLLIATRVFVLVLLAVAGSAFAQAPPPFTIGFASTQFTGAENSFPSIVMKSTGTVPANTLVEVSFYNSWGGGYATTITWDTGATQRVFSFSVDDNYYDPGRYITGTIRYVSNGGAVGTSSTTLLIVDDEKPPVISINDVTIEEGTSGPGIPATSATFIVSLTTPLSGLIFIPVIVHEQSAKNGSDFQWTAGGGVFFNAGQLSTTLSIPIVGDHDPEGDETFTVELVTPWYMIAGKSIGTCTILDDDGAVSPQFQRIAIGGEGVIHIRLGNPAAAAEQVILHASDPALVAVPSFVTIAAGASDADAEFTGLQKGAGSILVTLPPSRGGRTYELSVTVHDNTTLTIDPMQLNLSLGDSANVTARVDPLPAVPLRILIKPSKTGIVSLPDLVTTGPDGRVVIPVRTTALGFTTVNVALLDIDGGASADLGVSVTQGPGPAATSVVPAAGRATGGESVRLNGYNLSDHCAVSFGGIPAPDGTTQPGGNAIVLLTPPHAPGIVDIAIRCGTKSFLFPNAFEYQATSLRLGGVSPNSGTTQGGTSVYLGGFDFPFDSCTAARFGQAEASFVSVHAGTSLIMAVTPAHDAGIVAVTLVCGSQTATLPGGYTYVAGNDPQATVSTPVGFRQGIVEPITGSRLRRDDVFLINGIPLPDMIPTDGLIHWFALPEISGQAEMTLRDSAGRTITRTITIDPPPLPVVTKMPDRITLGAEFSVGGTGLRRGLTYMLGPAPLELIQRPVMSSRSSCCAPMAEFRVPISVGPGMASFTIADHGTVLVTKSVEVTASGPSVSAVTPQCTTPDGGALVTISGGGFDDGAAVQFGTTLSTDVIVRDRFTIIARVPPAFGIPQPQITVFNPDGSAATLTNAFIYKSATDDGGCSESATGGGRRRAAGH